MKQTTRSRIAAILTLAAMIVAGLFTNNLVQAASEECDRHLVPLLHPKTWEETERNPALFLVCGEDLLFVDRRTMIRSAPFPNHFDGAQRDLYAYPLSRTTYWVAVEYEEGGQEEFLFDGETWSSYEPDWEE